MQTALNIAACDTLLSYFADLAVILCHVNEILTAKLFVVEI